MKVSICMPTHEMNGRGGEFLDFCLSTIAKQTHKDIEVVVSDQSTNNTIKDVCEKWKNDLDIKYVFFDGARAQAPNSNNAMKHATGDIIKPMFVDDFFNTTNCIELFVDAFTKYQDRMWSAISFGHLHTSADGKNHGELCNFMNPQYHNEIHRGRNTVGCPSVIAFRKVDDIPLFDENLGWLMDTEFYRRLYDRFGDPILIWNIAAIGVRIHPDSGTAALASQDEKKRKELQYVIEKVEGVRSDYI